MIANASAAVVPEPANASSDIQHLWTEFYKAQLDEIVRTGKVSPAYVRSLPSRAYYCATLTCCSATCCLPCCMCDTACVVSQALTGKSCCWGLFSKFLEGAISDMMKDSKKEAKDAFVKNRNKLNHAATQDMCKQYLIEFDVQVAKRTPASAKVANEIRVQLHRMIVSYSPRISHMLLRDDGDIDKLRTAVYAEWTVGFERGSPPG